MRLFILVGVGLLVAIASACSQKERLRAAASKSEVDLALARLLTPPAVVAEPGFSAKMVVAPGEMYDPLDLVPYGDGALVADDGREDGETRGGRIFSVSSKGDVSIVVDSSRLLPPTGIDVAPPGFGSYAHHIFTLSQPRTTLIRGAWSNHVILDIDGSSRQPAEVFCTLPPNGTIGDGVPGVGFQARFGPAGSRFAGRLFAMTVLNATIYEVTAQRECRPFVTFDAQRWVRPIGFSFSLDGSTMFVAAERAAPQPASDLSSRTGVILSVAADGTIGAVPIAEGIERPFGVAVASLQLGAYAGQIFFTAGGEAESVDAVKGSRTLYRVTPDGKALPVASGFFRPIGVASIGPSIWVADIKGDFMKPPPGVQVPDGSIVRVDVVANQR